MVVYRIDRNLYKSETHLKHQKCWQRISANSGFPKQLVEYPCQLRLQREENWQELPSGLRCFRVFTWKYKWTSRTRRTWQACMMGISLRCVNVKRKNINRSISCIRSSTELSILWGLERKNCLEVKLRSSKVCISVMNRGLEYFLNTYVGVVMGMSGWTYSIH